MLRSLLVIIFCILVLPAMANAKQTTLPDSITLKGAVMKLIPEGEFIMGSDKKDNNGLQVEFGSVNPLYLDEHPLHKEKLKSYYINQYEITNQQYRDFVKGGGYGPPSNWMETGYIVSMKMNRLKALPIEKIRNLAVNKFRIDIDTRSLSKEALIDAIEKHFKSMNELPVHDVDWFGAEAYCEWIGAQLPTEKQWEKAARGTKGNEYPWGNDFEPGLSNTGDEDWPMGVAPVGSYQSDKSPFGIYDLAGNVTEWVFDWYDSYPNSDYKSEKFGKKYKVVRGAGWGGNGHYALHMYQRGAYRFFHSPDAVLDDLGFRCAADSETALNTH
ncbi:MAG TPA: formylglycine-generating enzyme family protein [Gammaproteobacteria bacterium]|nr:formylglycine-generating enzyme family protein [Gammaproteobacteria bacterium]